jgi:hypothetical protein
MIAVEELLIALEEASGNWRLMRNRLRGETTEEALGMGLNGAGDSQQNCSRRTWPRLM